MKLLKKILNGPKKGLTFLIQNIILWEICPRYVFCEVHPITCKQICVRFVSSHAVEANYKELIHRNAKQKENEGLLFQTHVDKCRKCKWREKTHWPISCDLALSCWKGVTSQWWECVCLCVLGYRKLRSGQGECLETTQAPTIRGPSLETEGGI